MNHIASMELNSMRPVCLTAMDTFQHVSIGSSKLDEGDAKHYQTASSDFMSSAPMRPISSAAAESSRRTSADVVAEEEDTEVPDSSAVAAPVRKLRRHRP